MCSPNAANNGKFLRALTVEEVALTTSNFLNFWLSSQQVFVLNCREEETLTLECVAGLHILQPESALPTAIIATDLPRIIQLCSTKPKPVLLSSTMKAMKMVKNLYGVLLIIKIGLRLRSA